jgi:hypothetical protein
MSVDERPRLARLTLSPKKGRQPASPPPLHLPNEFLRTMDRMDKTFGGEDHPSLCASTVYGRWEAPTA